MASKFDDFGGYYSCKIWGVEYARFAPSNIWSDYAESMKDHPGFSYEFVKVEVVA